jgi:glycosyltransferase involved in cell wall biosynthesis
MPLACISTTILSSFMTRNRCRLSTSSARRTLGCGVAISILAILIPQLWSYLAGFVERYDAVVLSLPEYAQKIGPPQRFIMPAINPFSTTNKELSEDEIENRLDHYGIPTDLPLVVQVSRFDKWKDPQGVIEAFRIARRQVEATLVLLGNDAVPLHQSANARGGEQLCGGRISRRDRNCGSCANR